MILDCKGAAKIKKRSRVCKVPLKKQRYFVPRERLELSRILLQRLLRPQRLPISPPGQAIYNEELIIRIEELILNN